MDPSYLSGLLVVLALLLVAGIAVSGGLFVKRAADRRCRVTITTSQHSYRAGEYVEGSVDVTALQELDIHSVTISLVGIERSADRSDAGGQDRNDRLFKTSAEVGPPQNLSRGGHYSYPFQLRLPATTADGGDESTHELAIGQDRVDFSLHASLHCSGVDIPAVRELSVSGSS